MTENGPGVKGGQRQKLTSVAYTTCTVVESPTIEGTLNKALNAIQ